MHNRPNSSGYPNPITRMVQGYQPYTYYSTPSNMYQHPFYQPQMFYPHMNLPYLQQTQPDHQNKVQRSQVEIRHPDTRELVDFKKKKAETIVPQQSSIPTIHKESIQAVSVDKAKEEEENAKVRAQFAQKVACLAKSSNDQKASEAPSNTTSAIPTQSVINDTSIDDSKKLDFKATQEKSQIPFKQSSRDVKQSEKQQEVKKSIKQVAADVLQKSDDINKTSKGKSVDNTSDLPEKSQIEKTSGIKLVDDGKAPHVKQPAFDKEYLSNKQVKQHAEKSQKVKNQEAPHHDVQQGLPLTTHPPTLQQPPIQPSLQSTSDDQGSEWQESKQKRKKKQQNKQQLKTSSSNGVKTELSRQSSNPLPTPIQAAPVCTPTLQQNTTQAQPPPKAPAPVWVGKLTQNYKKAVQTKGNSSTQIARNDLKDLKNSEGRGQDVKEAKTFESKVVDTNTSVEIPKRIEEQHQEVEIVKKNDTGKKIEYKKKLEEIKKVEDNKITEEKLQKEILESSADNFMPPKEIEKVHGLAKIVPQVIQNPVPEVKVKVIKEEVKQQITDTPKEEMKEKLIEASEKDITEKFEEKGEEAEPKKETEEREERDTDLDERKLMMSKFKYAEGQWSPMNPHGRKMYSREFLLSLRHECQEKPKLSDYDIVLTDSSSGAQNRGYSGRRNNNQNIARRQFSNEQVGRKVINLNMSRDVKLHTSENSWVKNKTESDETKLKGKKFRSILNKLTPQRYQVLVQQASELKLCTKEQLTHCIDILFEKAILEPSFASLYASLTKDLFLLEVPVTEGSHNRVAFKTILLSKCQTEFEKDKQEEKEIADLQKNLNEAEDEEEKKKLKEELDTAMWRGKKRSLGNTKFIGELFKLGRLTEKIMHECLYKLLKDHKDEDSLECLCQLFTTIGMKLDQLAKDANRRKEMESYFVTLKNLVDQKKTSPRIRFMISDVIDLRGNNWKPRRENNPKMIDQIHKEARMEEIEKQQRIAEMGQRRKFDDQQRPQTKMPSMQDGWSNVSKPPKSTYDVSKFKLSKTGVDENTKLGPPRRVWGRGSLGGAGAASGKQSKDSKVGANRFSVLSPSMEAADRSEETQSTLTCANDQYRASFNRPQLQSASQEKPKVSGSEGMMKAPFGTSQSANFGRKKENMSDEELEKKTKLIIDEYMHSNDMKEALECMELELFIKESWKNAVMFTYFSLILNLEKSTRVREQIGALHRNMLLKKMIPDPCCYSAGVKKLLAFSEDNVIDIPQVWDFVGEIVCPIFLENSRIPLNILELTTRGMNLLSDIEVEDCQPDSEAKLFAMLLKALKHHLGAFGVKELWEASGLRWNKMLPPDQIKAFIKKHALEYTEDSRQAGGRRHRLVSVNEDKNKLIDLFKKPGATVGEVQDWIHENMHISSSHTFNPSDLNFTADIYTALCMASLTKRPNSDSEYDLNEERFHHFVEVVKGITVNREDRQVRVLLALQELMHRLDHPPNILVRILEMSYDAEVFNSNAFIKWHDDTTITPGKGIALQTVKDFMIWLKEEKQEAK